MATLALSFCNTTGEGSHVLGRFDTETGGFRWIDFGRDGITSAQGLALAGGELYVALSIGEASHIATIDVQTFAPVNLVPFPYLLDLHSLCLHEGDLLAVSTGTDEIVRLSLPDLEQTGVVWRASEYRRDSQHLNAIVSEQGHLICSGFGLNPGQRWSTAADGFIYDITANEMLLRPIYHPHSVVFHRRHLYVCESSKSALLVDGQQLATFDGYTRGLAFLPDGRAVVGTSVGRHRDGETAAVLNPLDEGTRRGTCALHIFDPGSPHDMTVADLTALGNEIYDVLLLS